MRKITLLFVLFGLWPGIDLLAQIDTIHWLPPMHARDQWGPQYLYLSTPEADPFEVQIRNGQDVVLATVTISNSLPYRYSLGTWQSSPVLVAENQLNIPLKDEGLVIVGEKPFFAYFRAHSNSAYHAGDLTCKGRAALGNTFRIGHLVQAVDESQQRANFVGVMATEDSTLVTFSDFDPDTDFHSGGIDVQSSGPASLFLMKGESVVFSQYVNFSATIQPPNGFMGALLSSTKPVAVNCGSWIGAPVSFQAHDIGIDQIAPVELVGKEYILCKGNGAAILEHPIIIAHYNNTKIWLNGAAAPDAVLDAGEYWVVPTAEYSPAGNMYILSSEPVFVYQQIGGASSGDDAPRTAGLIFVPPINCGIPNAVDNIYQPNKIGNMSFEGGLMIVAMKDSVVTVRVDGAPVAIGAPAEVPGNPDFVTYRKLDLFDASDSPGTLSVVAEGAVQIAMYGRNEPASFAAFYSGFTTTNKPEIELSLIGDGVCPDTLIASGRFDGVQWVLEDSVLLYGPDTMLVTYTPGRYSATGYLGVCRRTDSAADSLLVDFVSPAFEFQATDPSCFGYSDGQISFEMPYGGLAPYQYSTDEGQHFSTQPTAGGLKAGAYGLVVRDATGCYNRPLEAFLGQPDSFGVDLVVKRMEEPVYPGDEVWLEGLPDRPILSAVWTPADSSSCADCLDYRFWPEASTWVTLTVTDTAGCPATDRLFVVVEPNVYAPNVIHPASQQENDRFTLFSHDPLRIRRLAIYDRWGDLMFEGEDLTTNDRAAGWDGRLRGREVPAGVYVFVASVETQSGRVLEFRGDLTVVR
ncbi:MAG: gliding motility-associated C-terminal domain-containing protein [Saprospiraceae bacterium]|nr:gliding motility-associated C-terminal domain-containing protein [Saprospiraceae bacterium]